MTDTEKTNEAPEGTSASKAMLGFCPSCSRNRESLPAPAEGTCPVCFNHLIDPCRCTFTQYMVGDGCSSCNPEHWKEVLKET